ncbi:MAG: hypothetical protein EOP02_05700 [Proteobacteria bacterium]|nr:MAG: hypothetical protein EOP02_05700 [Pseudomonadota bacterium]
MNAIHPRAGVTVTSNGISVSNCDVISETIVRLQQAGEGFRTPLLRAARDGVVNLVMAHGGQRISSRALKFQRPTVILLLDDLPTATGPDGWPQAAKLLRWARRGMFHATGGQELHYLGATVAAVGSGRLLLVEMRSEHHATWYDLAKRVAPKLQVLNLLPPNGGVHPVEGPPAGVVVQ